MNKLDYLIKALELSIGRPRTEEVLRNTTAEEISDGVLFRIRGICGNIDVTCIIGDVINGKNRSVVIQRGDENFTSTSIQGFSFALKSAFDQKQLPPKKRGEIIPKNRAEEILDRREKHNVRDWAEYCYEDAIRTICGMSPVINKQDMTSVFTITLSGQVVNFTIQAMTQEYAQVIVSIPKSESLNSIIDTLKHYWNKYFTEETDAWVQSLSVPIESKKDDALGHLQELQKILSSQ